MAETPKDHLVTISTKTIFKVLVVIFALWLAYITRQILLILFVSLLLSALIDPFADWAQRAKIPRGISVVLIYILIIAIFVLVAVVLIPPVITEASQLASNFGDLWQRAISKLGVVGDIARKYNLIPTEGFASSFQPLSSRAAESIFSTIGGFFVAVGSILLTAALTFYMVVEEDAIKKALRHIAPDEYQPFLNQLLYKIRQKLGQWLRGQLMLSMVVGVLTYVGLKIIGVDYAAVLGVTAGLLELIPYIGPLITAVVAIFLTFTQTGTLLKPLIVLGLMVVIQQFENHLLVPKIMQKAVGLNPIISIIALLVGVKLAGFIGALLSIPVATTISVFVQEITTLPKKSKS